MIFLKHVFRSIKRSPLQPIIIIITLTLAVATLLTAVKISINVINDTNYSSPTDANICDITVKPSKSDDVRFLLKEDAEEIIDGEGTVHGEFNLTALYKKDDVSKLVDLSATDLLSADDFYKFKFVEYGEFNNKNINNSIIISSTFAEESGLKLGDSLSVSLLNHGMNFTVQAIAVSEGILKSAEGVISIDGVLRQIAAANPAIESLGGDVIPYTSLKISLDDFSKTDEIIQKLSADERFDGKNIIKESENKGNADFFRFASLLLILTCTFLITILSVIVIFSSLDLLSKKRMKDSVLFMISGASSGQLNRILYLECFIYSSVSAVLGLLLSIGINKKLNVIFDWKTSDISFKLYDIPIVFVAAPAVVLFTAYLYTSKTTKLSVGERLPENSENKASEPKYSGALITLLIFVLFTSSSFLITPKYRYVCAFPAFAALLAFIFLFVPCFVDLTAAFLIKLVERRSRVPAKSLLALKNMKVSYPIKHTARLITLLLTIISTVLICAASYTKEVKGLSSLFNCEYVSIGANERSDAILEDLDTVEDTFRFNFTYQMHTEEDTAVLALSMSDDALPHLNPNLSPKTNPKGNEVVITSGTANLLDKKLGDQVTFFYETNRYTFTIKEILRASSNVIFFDSSYIGEENELLCIKSSINKTSEDYREIANLLETRGAEMVELGVILEPINSKILSYVELLIYVVAIAFFTTTLGIINVFVSSYVARQRERAVYYTVGMSKQQIRRAQYVEMLYLMVISIVLIPLFTFLLVLTIDTGIGSFGIDLIYI